MCVYDFTSQISCIFALLVALVISTCATVMLCFFFFNCTPTPEIYTYCPTLSLHDALPISRRSGPGTEAAGQRRTLDPAGRRTVWPGRLAAVEHRRGRR